MRKVIIFFLAGVGIWSVNAQIVENFNDGSFTDGNPLTWVATTVSGSADFVVTSGELNSKGPAATGDLSISTNLGVNFSTNEVVWTFKARYGFGPSSGNRTEIYLMSNNADVRAATQGYYIRLGEDGSGDGIDLYRIGSSTAIISDPNTSVATTINTHIRVTRSNTGVWTVEADATGGNSFVMIGSVTDTNFSSGAFFGFRVVHSSTRNTAFFFDDITLTLVEIPDTDPPLLSSATATSATTIDVQFNEPLDPTTAQNLANYALNGGATVSNAVLDGTDPSLVHLTISALTNGQSYTLTVNNVADVNENVIADNSTIDFTYLVLSVAGFRDVVINEFMADAAPPVGLPETDFVELYNPTDTYFDLTGWRIGDNAAQSGTIGSFILAPDSYLIVSPTAFVTEFEPLGDSRGVSTFPNFNSTTPDAVVLYNASGVAIDRVNYTSGVPSDGVTFEQVDPTLICSGTFNFRPSENSQGGTPGAQNSVFLIVPDNFGPSVAEARAISADSVRLDFDETINGALIPTAVFQISPAVNVEEAVYVSEYPASVFLKLASAITPNVTYTITMSGICDCSGNALEGNEGTFVLGAAPQQGDVLLSEVLFNPRTGGSDFVELFNPSATSNFELRGWKLARLVNGQIDSPKPIASDGLNLAPRSFLVFTADAANIAQEYPQGNPDTYVHLAGMPSYNDTEGIVLLLNEQDEIMQQFEYTDDFHYDLLESEDGVSLERISYTSEVNDKNNWRSAASTVGFATPGRPNSQSAELATPAGKLSVDPKVFLPGNAGTGRDFTTINYQFSRPGQFANIMIYDQQGRPVKQLANGASLANEGFFRWDGTTDRGGMARMGYYLVVFELYDGAGKTQTMKETVVVGRGF